MLRSHLPERSGRCALNARNWIVAFVFQGTFLKPEFVIWPFRLFTVIQPLRYTFRSVYYLQFIGTLWEGAQLSSDPTGFTCGSQPGFCYGRTGEQVLSSLSHLFSPGVENTVAKDMGIVLLIAFVFKMIWLLIIVLRTNRAKLGTAETPVASAETAAAIRSGQAVEI